MREAIESAAPGLPGGERVKSLTLSWLKSNSGDPAHLAGIAYPIAGRSPRDAQEPSKKHPEALKRVSRASWTRFLGFPLFHVPSRRLRTRPGRLPDTSGVPFPTDFRIKSVLWCGVPLRSRLPTFAGLVLPHYASLFLVFFGLASTPANAESFVKANGFA